MFDKIKRKRRKKNAYLDKIYKKYSMGGNLYPKPMSDSEFRELIVDYILGEKYYIADPLPQKQANVILALDIINRV